MTHDRFYWLQLSNGEAKARHKITANCKNQSISVTARLDSPITLLLHDDLIDLDRPINVTLGGKDLQPISAERTIAAIANSIVRYGAARSIPTASTAISLKP